MELNPQQKVVLSGMVSAGFFTLAFMIIGFLYFPLNLPPLRNFDEKLAFTLRADIFAAVILLLTIMTASFQRFWRPRAIEGESLSDGSSLDINVRVANNTLEQFILLFFSHMTLVTYANEPYTNLIPLSVAWFIIARITYWVGYHISPAHRAFGLAATFYPTIVFLLYGGMRIFGEVFFGIFY